ncbi:hypothetical protein DPMN_184411 [Dreissena polymorpha]|uniref:Uncharacterized protein n=1 Tax=Dreissena polymorpha TaxID=45954 RepID=A0A9D4DJH5_DREPO|nr:hypothetical protein DPMN_184411 [Dreissena polymorpha]
MFITSFSRFRFNIALLTDRDLRLAWSQKGSDRMEGMLRAHFTDMKNKFSTASYVCSTGDLSTCGYMPMLISAHVVYRKPKPTGAAPALGLSYGVRCESGEPPESW